jgi:hypothetical protein
MTITTEEAERFVELGKVVPDGFRRIATAISTLASERDAFRAENATAHKDALEEAARRLEELHKNHRYSPQTGEGSEHDTGYYRAVAEGVAHILALAKEEQKP